MTNQRRAPTKKSITKDRATQTPYKSLTDMGVNRAGFAIINDDATREAATQETIRRFFKYRCEHAIGLAERSAIDRCRLLMEERHVTPTDRFALRRIAIRGLACCVVALSAGCLTPKAPLEVEAPLAVQTAWAQDLLDPGEPVRHLDQILGTAVASGAQHDLSVPAAQAKLHC